MQRLPRWAAQCSLNSNTMAQALLPGSTASLAVAQKIPTFSKPQGHVTQHSCQEIKLQPERLLFCMLCTFLQTDSYVLH